MNPLHNRRCTILVVDDSGDTREVLKLGLQIHGFEVEEAGNGREALQSLAAHHFDALLTDLWMPEMDGAELIRITRARPETACLPIILMTAAHDDGVAQGMQIDALLKKPFDFALLLGVLARMHCDPSMAAAVN